MAKINFYSEETDFVLKNKLRKRHWLTEVAKRHQASILELSYIFCTDEYLLGINKEYLNHDTYTDIITFNNGETPNKIEGDIFISIDRIKENAEKYKTPFENELDRVLVHGLLHLLGFKDKKKEEQAIMRNKEDEQLELLKSL